VVVDNFYCFGADVSPPEAQTPPIIDSNAEATGTITLQRLEAITRWDPQIVKTTGNVELSELAPRDRGDTHEAPNVISLRERFSVRTLERSDHTE